MITRYAPGQSVAGDMGVRKDHRVVADLRASRALAVEIVRQTLAPRLLGRVPDVLVLFVNPARFGA